MPTYDYQCRSCGNVTEVIHSMTEDGPTTCEVCGGPLRRILYPAGIIFKGSGFYKTDSRSASKAASAAKPAGDAKTGEAKAADAKAGEAKGSDAASTTKASDGSGSTGSSTSSSQSVEGGPKPA